MECGSCASAVPEGARFCPACGHLLVQTEERRIVSVLFADLVGFTKLAEERDPEHVKHLVDRSFQRLVADITAFGGTVDKIVGDGIVALFGAPRAHEDDPERAVRAALRMQRSLAETTTDWGVGVQMRVGVNTGEVLVGAIRAGGDYTAMGDTVNLASRLEGAAAPGEVLVGPSTQQATAHVIEYEDRGEVAVRGRDEAVRVFVARRELAPPGRRRRSVRGPLVGRSLEHLQVTSAIDTSVERRRAQLIMILGEAGLGKTRLAEEVATTVEENHDALIVEGRVLPYGETNPYRPIAEAIADGLGIEPLDPESVAVEKVTVTVSRVMNIDADSAEADGVVQSLLHILGYESALQSLDKTRAREEIHAGLRQYIAAITASRPVVVVLGDVNWADEALLNLIESSLAGLANEPFVVIATARWTVDEERWIVPPGRHNTMVLNLDPLDRDASDRLVRSLLGADVSDDIASVLFDRSGGNPFFLEELTSLMSEPVADGAVAAGEIGELPGTIRGLVAARLDALSAPERAMAEEAAVIGRSGPVYALLLMAEMDGRPNPERVFRQLVGKDLFRTVGDQWAFRSDLVRDIAYQTLTKTVRARHHVAIGSWLEAHGDEDGRSSSKAGGVAWHFYSAAKIVQELGPVEDVGLDVIDGAIYWLTEAGGRAAERDSHFSAGRFYAQALELLSADDPRRIEVALGRSRARMGLLELSGARHDVHDALDLATSIGDDRSVAMALTLAGEVEGVEAEYDESRRILRTAIDRWRDLDDKANLAEALRLHGFASMMAGDEIQARDDFGLALKIFVDVEDASGEAWCQQNLAWLAFTQGHVVDAEQGLRRAIELFERNNDAGGLGWAWGLFAFLKFHQGDSVEAEEIAVRIQNEASLRGDRFGAAMMSLLIASIHLWAGRCREAIDIANEALSVFQNTETTYGKIQALGTLGRAHVAIGNFKEADRMLTECRELAQVAPGRPLLGFAQLVSGATAMQRGDFEGAFVFLEAGGDEVNDLQILGSMDRGVTVGLANLQRGEADLAKAVLDEMEQSELSSPTAYLDSARSLVEVALGNVETGFDAADRVLASSLATYLDRRSALIARGLGSARLGDEPATREMFAAAIEMIDGTDSRSSQAVTRLAFAIALAALNAPDAAEVRSEADGLLSSIGITHKGWHTAFEAAVGGAGPAAADAPEDPSA